MGLILVEFGKSAPTSSASDAPLWTAVGRLALPRSRTKEGGGKKEIAQRIVATKNKEGGEGKGGLWKSTSLARNKNNRGPSDYRGRA